MTSGMAAARRVEPTIATFDPGAPRVGHRLFSCLIGALFLLPWLPCADAAQVAADAPAREEAIVLETLVVSGKMPGPGLWKVSRDGHVMWVLGTVQPVARDMEWASDDVAARVAAAGKVLMPPRVSFDLGIGKFRQLMLLPRMLGARRNPGRERLQDTVPPEDYARWVALKERYMGRDRKVETFRPVFAAGELSGAALKKSGLQYRGLVRPVVEKVAKEHGVEIEQPRLEIPIADPKAAIRAFRQTEIDDAQCFHQTLEHLENDLSAMRIRANAWARGDLLTLQEVTFTNPSQACMDAVLESRFAEEQGIHDLGGQLDALWLERAQAVIGEHETSFAALPMEKLLGENGQLAALAARGYTVEAP